MAKTALVLSAGGMFGAYQAGVWKVLGKQFSPDMVVGTSIGAINGWAIASECDPDQLIERWRNLEQKRPQHLIRQLHSDFSPRIDYGLVVTDTLRLRPRIFRGPDLTWRHLAASAAVPGLHGQQWIDRRLYSDGGLLGALPLWAAVEMGADRIIAINALPKMPSVIVRKLAGAIQAISRFRPVIPSEVIQIAPSEPLGPVTDMLYWNRDNAERWIAQGIHDASLGLAGQALSTVMELPKIALACPTGIVSDAR